MTTASTQRLQRTSRAYLLIICLTLLSQPSQSAESASLGLTLAGLFCVAIACLGRIWCSVFIAGRKDQQLVTQGPYALVRHPLYSLSMVAALGIGLATLSGLLTIGLLAGLAWLLRDAALSEERRLSAVFEEAYQGYRAVTPRFWPRLGAWLGSTRSVKHLPTSLTVHPPILWKAFVDASAFFLLFICIVSARQISLFWTIPAPLYLP